LIQALDIDRFVLDVCNNNAYVRHVNRRPKQAPRLSDGTRDFQPGIGCTLIGRVRRAARIAAAPPARNVLSRLEAVKNNHDNNNTTLPLPENPRFWIGLRRDWSLAALGMVY
jgi:hypothetical protein